jgi:hypothetical protein
MAGMNTMHPLLAGVAFLFCLASAHADELVLADAGQSGYRIVVPAEAAPPVRHAADELQSHLERITGVKLPIVDDRQPPSAREIVLQSPDRLKALGVAFDKPFRAEDYAIRTVGNHLVIAGGHPRGTLYGVYGLLEEHLGCRWFAPGVDRIAKRPRLALPKIDEIRRPVLEYREPFTFDCFDGDWCARNRVNSSAGRLTEKHGGKVRFGSGFFVHTFERLVPPQTHFDAHPEYFSLVKGKRLKEHSQLCCTNEAVIQLCIEGVRAAMRAQPDATVFSVSQNDWANYCECENCQAVAEAEQSQIAPVLALVNRVAEAVEGDFPDRAVETLAYQWTRKAPKSMRPRPNVIVRLCSIECCFSHPLATCNSPANEAFRNDAAAWAKVCNRLWVWDYVTDFNCYLLPFPNQRVRRDNIRFFIRHNVTGIFEQDTYNSPHSELAALGGYLTAKFLWNPDYNENQAIDEFLTGYYGAAAEPIRQYINLLHDRVEKENIHVNIWAPVTSPHLTDDLLVAADALWQTAEDRVRDSADARRRVQISRLSVDFAVCERAMLMSAKKLPVHEPLRQLASRRAGIYLDTLKTSGLTHLREHLPVDFEQYGKAVEGVRLEPVIGN